MDNEEFVSPRDSAQRILDIMPSLNTFLRQTIHYYPYIPGFQTFCRNAIDFLPDLEGWARFILMHDVRYQREDKGFWFRPDEEEPRFPTKRSAILRLVVNNKKKKKRRKKV